MKKTIISIITCAIIAAAGFLAYINYSAQSELDQPIPPITSIITDPHDAKYTINEEEVVLVNKMAYTRIPGATATTTTTYFGNDATGDIDQDGTTDTAFLVTQTNGGSGTFYYLVAQLNKKEGVFGTYGYLLGDRIAPQSISIDTDGIITVNYADRKPGEPFTTQPTVGKSIVLKLNASSGQFEVVKLDSAPKQNAPSSARLSDRTWTWMQTTEAHLGGTAYEPKNPDKFKLTFKGNSFSATTDCNGIGGEYKVTGNKMVLDKMMSTMMYCEGSQEAEYSKMLAQVTSFDITTNNGGELLLNLKNGSVMLYR